MCDCASCTHTDNATVWPSGEAKGPAKARAEYSAHVAHGKRWGDWFNHDTQRFEPRIRDVPDFTIKPEPVYPCTGTRGCGPVAPMPAWWYAWNARTAKALEDASPQDAVILDMANEQAKRGRGRPAIPGRFVVVKLEERHIARARELGNKKVAAGIRVALSQKQGAA